MFRCIDYFIHLQFTRFTSFIDPTKYIYKLHITKHREKMDEYVLCLFSVTYHGQGSNWTITQTSVHTLMNRHAEYGVLIFVYRLSSSVMSERYVPKKACDFYSVFFPINYWPEKSVCYHLNMSQNQ